MDLDKSLHILAREVADKLVDPDKKQLRFNDIVSAAKTFYNDPRLGVRELVQSCDKKNEDVYVHKRPMWQTLRDNYGWMIHAT